MTTLETRHRETTNSIARTVAQRDACLANLVRYEVKLKALRKLEARQQRALCKQAQAPAPQPAVPAPEPAPAYVPGASLASKIDDAMSSDGALPVFLDRRKQIEARDAATKAEMAKTKADRKLAKSRGRIAKMKAKQSGEMRRMPLTGKAALEHIRQG